MHILKTVSKGWILILVAALNMASDRALSQQQPAQGETPSLVVRVRADDPEGLLKLAGVLHRRGQHAQAAEIASAAFRSARTAEQRFLAAMISAEAAVQQQKYTHAQIWLRRADQNAATDQQRELVSKRYRQISLLNPVKLQFQLSVAPSNNVNNGASVGVIEIGGIPFTLGDSDLQLSGYRADASAALSFRVSESSLQRTDVIVEVSGRKVWLDSEAQEEAPEADGSDFDQVRLAGGLRHKRLIWPDIGPSSLELTFGRAWYGGAELLDWRQLEVAQTIRLGTRSALNVALDFREEFNAMSETSDVATTSALVEWVREPRNAGPRSAHVLFRDASSDAATLDYAGFGLGASFRLPGPAGIRPRLDLKGEVRDYRSWVITPGGRKDRIAAAEVSADIAGMSFYGFVPNLRLYVSRTWSDVDIFSRSETSLSLGYRSRL